MWPEPRTCWSHIFPDPFVVSQRRTLHTTAMDKQAPNIPNTNKTQERRTQWLLLEGWAKRTFHSSWSDWNTDRVSAFPNTCRTHARLSTWIIKHDSRHIKLHRTWTHDVDNMIWSISCYLGIPFIFRDTINSSVKHTVSRPIRHINQRNRGTRPESMIQWWYEYMFSSNMQIKQRDIQ